MITTVGATTKTTGIGRNDNIPVTGGGDDLHHVDTSCTRSPSRPELGAARLEQDHHRNALHQPSLDGSATTILTQTGTDGATPPPVVALLAAPQQDEDGPQQVVVGDT